MAKPRDLTALCRLCLQECSRGEQLQDIFGPGEAGSSTLHMRIMASVSLEIHRTDNLPKGICAECRYQLEKTYVFRNRCRNNDARLRRHVKLVAAGKVSRLLEEEDDDDEFEESLEYIRESDGRKNAAEKVRWDEKVSALEVEFQAVSELQRSTLYEEVRNELLSKRYEDKVDVGTMTGEGDGEMILPIEMEEERVEEADSGLKIMDCYSMAEKVKDSKKKLRDKIHAKLVKQDEELIQYLEEERLMSVDEEDEAKQGENDGIEILEAHDEMAESAVEADQFIITEVSDSETYVVDTEEMSQEDQDMYGYDDDSDEDLEAVTNAVKAELAERPNLNVDENCVMKVEKNRDLTKVEVRATDGSLICMEFSRERKSPSPSPRKSTFHVKLAAHEYVCTNCPLTFKNSKKLEMHTCLAKDARTYPCDVCRKVFPSSTAHKRHYRIHTGEKPYSCLLCDRSFVQKEVLKRHMLTHSDTRPHSCDHCPRRFNQKDQLRHHVNRCHSENPLVTIHKCHVCRKTFKHGSGLSRHMSTHLGRTFPCESCGRQFNDKSALKRHEYAIHGPGAGWKKGGGGGAAAAATATTSTAK